MLEDSGMEIYEDLIDYVLYRFQVNTRNFRVLLLTDPEFEVFNYECDVVKTFYYKITMNDDFGFNRYKNQYYEMVTKEYGEFFYQSEDDSYISAALIHIDKVYNTIAPVYDAIEILNSNKGTDKDVTFLHSLLTENAEYEYLVLLREKRHQDLLNNNLEGIKIYFDIIHEALHIVEHEKPPAWWKIWNKKHKSFEEMNEITYQLYNEWIMEQ
jgi:hypothetical protein